MYYGVIGRLMEVDITDLIKVGQLVVSRKYDDTWENEGVGRRGLVVNIEEVDNSYGHTIKIVWQDTGEIERMPDWFAAELLKPLE